MLAAFCDDFVTINQNKVKAAPVSCTSPLATEKVFDLPCTSLRGF